MLLYAEKVTYGEVSVLLRAVHRLTTESREIICQVSIMCCALKTTIPVVVKYLLRNRLRNANMLVETEYISNHSTTTSRCDGFLSTTTILGQTGLISSVDLLSFQLSPTAQ